MTTPDSGVPRGRISGFLESRGIEVADANAQDLAPRLHGALGTALRIERELAGGGMSRVFIAQEISRT